MTLESTQSSKITCQHPVNAAILLCRQHSPCAIAMKTLLMSQKARLRIYVNMINTLLYHPGLTSTAEEIMTTEGPNRTEEVTRTKAQDEDPVPEIGVAVETDIATEIRKIIATIILPFLLVRIEATEVTKVMGVLATITIVTEIMKDAMIATFPTEIVMGVREIPIVMTLAETSIGTITGLITIIRAARANIIGILNQPKSNATTRTSLIGKEECNSTIIAPSQASL
jgi:hypothetical protein